MDAFDLYLASASPRRAELLSQIGLTFRRISGEVDESVRPAEVPQDYVLRLAREKVLAGWQSAPCDRLHPVLAADTAVVVDGEILGKPNDPAHAAAMLARLAGRTHQVMTGVALCSGPDLVQSALSVSEVTFRALSADEQAAYVACGEGVDKAGGYAVQGRAARYITGLQGSYSGVMGLPLHCVDALLNALPKRI